jgi:hypothetical protein
VPEPPSLPDLWRRAVDAQLGYYRSVGQLTVEYGRAMAGVLRDVRASRPSPAEAAPLESTPLGSPVMVLEAEEGSSAVGMFVVENRTRGVISAPIDVPVLADAEGRQVRPELRFEPEVVTLEAAEHALVQIAVSITKALRTGVDYRGEVTVPGLTGTRIPLVVRRLPRARPARRSTPRRQKVTE